MSRDSIDPANDNGPSQARTTPKPCPICGRPANPDTRPFCSKRCADVDLHRWLGGTYAIPAGPSEEDDDAPSIGGGDDN